MEDKKTLELATYEANVGIAKKLLAKDISQ